MELERILEGLETMALCADPKAEISDICFDSRRAAQGALFIAVRGEASDGHDYIEGAVKGGCCAVICECAPKASIPYVLVADTRAALYTICDNFFDRPQKKLIITGVTGTNGKTTVTSLLQQVLEQCLENRVGLIGTNGVFTGGRSLGAERTTPEYCDLLRYFDEMVSAGCTHCVMEVSSHSLALGRVRGIEFACGVFTNLTQDHLDFHGSMEEYGRAKARLFEQSRRIVCCLDNDEWGGMRAAAESFGALTVSAEDDSAGLFAADISLQPDCVTFLAVMRRSSAGARLNIPGKFSVLNALCVLGAGCCLGMTLSALTQALAKAKGAKGRLETLHTDGDFTVVIDYAHTPDALKNVLQCLRETAKGRLVCVFGCGGDRDRTKRPLMGRIGVSLSDFAIVTSDNPRTERPEAIINDIVEGLQGENERFIRIVSRPEAIAYAIENHLPGDTILLAGKGHETYQEINGVKLHMDEREIVAGILERGT